MDPTKLEELKLMSDDYRYRDQMMVTEFGLSMTAIALAANALVRTQDWTLQLIIVTVATVFSVLVSNHLSRINKDRVSAGYRRTQLLKELGMHQPHHGYERKQIPFTFPAPISFVVFAWTVTTMLFVGVLYLAITGSTIGY